MTILLPDLLINKHDELKQDVAASAQRGCSAGEWELEIPPKAQVCLIFKDGWDANTKASVSSNIFTHLNTQTAFPYIQGNRWEAQTFLGHKWWATTWGGCISDHCLSHRQQLLINLDHNLQFWLEDGIFALYSFGRAAFLSSGTASLSTVTQTLAF